jgi:hypothetical protein
MELAEKKDVSVIKEVIHEVAQDIKLGILIGKDGVTKEDLVHVPAVIDRVKAIITLAQKISEIKAEASDIDASEVGEILLAIWSETQAKA